MEDRIPLYPGRVKMVPVEGQPDVYDMTRADEAIRDGTPINKTNLLKDTTAEQFGLDSAAVPDDILSWLGKYNEHWWSALHGDATYEIDMSPVTTNIYIYGSTANESPEDRTLYVSKTVSVVDGALVLDDKAEYVSESRNLKPLVDEYAPCYISNLYGDPTGVYYLPEGTTVQTTAVSESKGKTIHWSSSSGAVMLASSGSPRAKTVGVETVSAGEIAYKHSLDRNAYPDSGTVGNIMYAYMGVPFENIVAPLTKIEYGSYVGTGVYGVGNKNNIVFSFEPKVVFITVDNATNHKTGGLAWIKGASTGMSAYGYSSYYVYLTLDHNILSWYSATSAIYQLNYTDMTYYYIALG